MDPEDLQERLAVNIAALRKRKGWSLEMLADHADLRKSSISNLLNRQTFCRLDTLAKLARAFGVKPSRLIE